MINIMVIMITALERSPPNFQPTRHNPCKKPTMSKLFKSRILKFQGTIQYYANNSLSIALLTTYNYKWPSKILTSCGHLFFFSFLFFYVITSGISLIESGNIFLRMSTRLLCKLIDTYRVITNSSQFSYVHSQACLVGGGDCGGGGGGVCVWVSNILTQIFLDAALIHILLSTSIEKNIL